METLTAATSIDQKVKDRIVQTWTTCRPGVMDALHRLEKITAHTQILEEHELAYLHLYVIFTNGERIEHELHSCEGDYFQQKERYQQFKNNHPTLSAYFDSII